MNLNNGIAQADLSTLHTFGLQATAKAVRPLADQSDLLDYIGQAMRGEPVVLLGEGSNTVFVSESLDATVWCMQMKGRQYLGVQDGSHVFRLAAGENWHNWVEWSVMSGYPGLENLALIPGTVGASPIQNIGAYGVELMDRILSVHGFDVKTGETRTLSNSECKFQYRDSIFKHELKDRFVITEVDFALPVEWRPVVNYGDVAEKCEQFGPVTAQNIMKAVIQIRTGKLPDPKALGNSGSFFKNPIVPVATAQSLKAKWPDLPVFEVDANQSKLAAGWLIDQCGLKGFKLGEVQVYPKQALILTNLGGAKGTDLSRMIEHIQSTVEKKFGVSLEAEPNIF